MSDTDQSTSSGAAEVDQDLYEALLARLIRSGEWARIQSALRQALYESGALDDTLDHARETLRQSPDKKFDSLFAEVEAYGSKRVPEEVRERVRGMLMAFLERNLRGS